MLENQEIAEVKKKKKHTFLFWITLFALLLRLIPVFITRDLGIGLDDMFQYDMLARSIVNGDGYRWYAQDDLDLVDNYIDIEFLIDEYDTRGVLTSFRAPLYPAMLAVIYWLFGIGTNRFLFIRLLQAILGALLVPLTYAISNLLWANRRKVSNMAAIITATYPMLLIYPLSLATENLFFFLVLSSLFVLLKASNQKNWHLYFLSGLLLGFTTLTRSVILLFALLAVLWVFFILKERRNAAILLAGIIVLTLPWIVRNSILHGRFVGVESSLGYNLYVGYHPNNTGTFQYGISMDLIPILDDGIRDEIGRSKAMEFIKTDPARVFYLMIRRMGYFLGLEKRALIYFYANNFFGFIPRSLLILLSVVLLTPFILLSCSAVLGFSLAKWNRRSIILIFLIMGYLLPHVLILGEARFHLVLVPVLAIGAAEFWKNVFAGVNPMAADKVGRIRLTISSLIVLIMVFNWIFEMYRDKQLLSAIFSIHGNTLYLPY